MLNRVLNNSSGNILGNILSYCLNSRKLIPMKTNFEWAVGRRPATFFSQGVVHTLTSSLIVFPSLSCLMIPRFGFAGASSSFLTSR